jgi:HPt (histidine-containing phosphotransfer) domain-containing protein
VKENQALENGGVDSAELLARVENDHDLLRELIGIFKEEFPRRLQDLRDAISKHDTERVASLSHALKGMLFNLAVHNAGNRAAKLEQLARAGDKPSLKDSFSAFESEVERLLPELETYLTEAQR